MCWNCALVKNHVRRVFLCSPDHIKSWRSGLELCAHPCLQGLRQGAGRIVAEQQCVSSSTIFFCYHTHCVPLHLDAVLPGLGITFKCQGQLSGHRLPTNLAAAAQGHALHYAIWKYCQSTSKVHAQVLQNLRVHWARLGDVTPSSP